MQMKKKNAAEIDAKFPSKKDHAALRRDETGDKAAFPSYDEFEMMPGKGKKPTN